MPHLAHQKHLRNKKNLGHPVLNRLVLVLAVLEPMMTLPQVYEVWINHQTAGVSLITWSFFTISAATWFIYGLTIKNTPLIISGALWVLLESSVVVGVLVR